MTMLRAALLGYALLVLPMLIFGALSLSAAHANKPAAMSLVHD